jgi:hypothetical protein
LSGEPALLEANVLPEPMEALRSRWLERVSPLLTELRLPVATDAPPPDGDARTRRTDDFAWLHGQFTMVARSEVAATW